MTEKDALKNLIIADKKKIYNETTSNHIIRRSQ